MAWVTLRSLIILNWIFGAPIAWALLAQVFLEGTRLREDLEGTV